MKAIIPKDFKATANTALSEWPTTSPIEASEKKKMRSLGKLQEKLSSWQEVLYAHNRYSLLICLQGMDTSGKDSLIREVFNEFNSRGVEVDSFKRPNENELQHDYLWRHYIELPERGKVGIFNRTHYENVIASKVHPEYLLKENLPDILSEDDVTDAFWQSRYRQINNFEKHLTENGTIILKFFMHLSKEEQKNRLLRRLEEKKHNWKFSPGDLEERRHWDAYMQAFEQAINATSKSRAPWYIIPADDKQMARVIVAKIIWKEVSRYSDIRMPELDEEIQQNINLYRSELEKD